MGRCRRRGSRQGRHLQTSGVCAPGRGQWREPGGRRPGQAVRPRSPDAGSYGPRGLEGRGSCHRPRLLSTPQDGGNLLTQRRLQPRGRNGVGGPAGRCQVPWEANMAPAVSWKSRSCCRKRMACEGRKRGQEEGQGQDPKAGSAPTVQPLWSFQDRRGQASAGETAGSKLAASPCGSGLRGKARSAGGAQRLPPILPPAPFARPRSPRQHLRCS